MIKSELILDTRSLTDETTETPVLTNTEITRFLQRRINQVIARILSLRGTYFGYEDTTIDLVNGQQSYDLVDTDSNQQTRIEGIDAVKIAYDGTNFVKSTALKVQDFPDTNTTRYSQRAPRHALVGRKLYIFPTPSANATNGLKLFYPRRPDPISADTDSPFFSPLYHHILPYGAAADVKRKDGDAADIELIRDLEGQFQAGLEELLVFMGLRDMSESSVVGDDEYDSLFDEFDISGRNIS